MHFGNHRIGPSGEEKDKRKANWLKFLQYRLVWVKRFQYAFIVIICTAVLFFQIGKCIEKYYSNNTGTADKYVHVSKTAFPELTICPTYPYKLDKLIANGISTKSEIQFGANWISNDSRKSPQDFYNEIVLNVDDIVQKVTIYVEQLVNGKNIVNLGPLDTICNGQTLFTSKQYYYNGNCFALVLPDCLRNAGPLEVVFEFIDKTDIFIHHFGQFLSPNSRSRVDVDKGKFVKIAISHEVVQLLSGEDFGTCVDNYGKSKDFDDCMYTKMHKLMIDEVGCTVPWLPDKSKICVQPTKRTQAFDVYQKNRRNQQDICPNSCLFTNMYFGPPVTGINGPERSELAWGVFYFRRDIKTTNEYILYTLLSMAAEIGGYVGLLLGASLVNLGRINSFLLDLCFGEEDKKEPMENKVKAISYPKTLLVTDKTNGDTSNAPYNYTI
jgi:hypothetical protein